MQVRCYSLNKIGKKGVPTSANINETMTITTVQTKFVGEDGVPGVDSGFPIYCLLKIVVIVCKMVP